MLTKVIAKFIKKVTDLVNDLALLRNRIRIGADYNFNGILFIRNSGIVNIGAKFRVSSGGRFNPIGGDVKSRLYCAKGAILNIGNNVGISNSTIFTTNAITIEDNVMIGGSCKIWDTDFHSIDPVERIQKGDRNITSKPIVIKKNAFIGAGTIILKGVCIGENSVIGAASVVTKNIPSNEVWAGNPAKKIRDLN